MHLVINATEVGRRRGGNESYVLGLVEGLADLHPALEVSLLTCNWGHPLPLPAAFRQINLGVYRRFPFFLWQQTIALRRLKADWYLANFFLPPVLPCRGIAVVHDLSFRAHPEYFPTSVAWYMRWLTGLAIRQASLVVTGSEFSRQELLRFYAVRPDKVKVTPYAMSASFCPLPDHADLATEVATLERYGIPRPYILAVGNIHPRKNLARLLEAYLKLRSTGAGLPALVWGGLQRWESHELIQRAQAAGVVLPGFIADEDLPTLYRQAEMLVYPSLYEGFGLPPLEAMACGTPVITSNTTSLPEVVGEGALTVDPTNVEEIAAAMASLLADPGLCARLRSQGLRRAADFSWKSTAQVLLERMQAVTSL